MAGTSNGFEFHARLLLIITFFHHFRMEVSTSLATTLFCSYCDFRCYSHSTLLKHVKLIHENDPRFNICCLDCGRSFKKWCSLKKHLH